MNNFPAVILPADFVLLLKDPAAASTAEEGPVSRLLKSDSALTLVMTRAFAEFDENKKGLLKVFTALGWAHFRDRMASVYLFKAQNGAFPPRTDMALVKEVNALEARFAAWSVTGPSRVFLLGLYLRFCDVLASQLDDMAAMPRVIPPSVDQALALSGARSTRADWLILLCWHMDAYLGSATLLAALKAASSYRDLYRRLTPEQREQLVGNLLAYGASIREEDPFLFERI
jgi:hypothetical protein